MLIPKGSFSGGIPTPCFWHKSLQAVENKSQGCVKRFQEAATG